MSAVFTTTFPTIINASCSSEYELGEPPNEREEAIRQVIVFVAVSLLIVTIVGGNATMVASIVKFKKLRTTQNIFLASLAMSDLLLGILVLPFSLMRELVQHWPIGRFFCKVYLAIDIFLCTASIWNLCIISINRYWATTHGIKYRTSKRTQRAIVLVIFAWVWSAVVCGPAFIYSTAVMAEDECHHSTETWYILFSVSGSFYVPLFIMLITYGKITYVLYKQARSGNFISIAMRRQKRLNLMIGIILGAFVVCWLPFFQTYVTQTLCPTCCVPGPVFKFLEWFAYCNSAFNPFIYNLNNTKLRKAFKKILRCEGNSHQVKVVRIQNKENGAVNERIENDEDSGDSDEMEQENEIPPPAKVVHTEKKTSFHLSRQASLPANFTKVINESTICPSVQFVNTKNGTNKRKSFQYIKQDVAVDEIVVDPFSVENSAPAVCWVLKTSETDFSGVTSTIQIGRMSTIDEESDVKSQNSDLMRVPGSTERTSSCTKTTMDYFEKEET
uniref:alpha-2A adrenergic receptor-like n=1 Tax=Ciona intestinalis TaxID=7719 RepID=UPI000EF442A4|nr:alpha-2A adrenergic receptor-like [Ciona intestinalis]|eukprot:XP_026692396.1 alpha-2A adrenergic receptor-like [Ciona intestinalis]